MVVVAAAVASGCGSAAPLPAVDQKGGPPSHALIYVIHGDGDYLYHQDGRAKQADIEALATARLVARNAPDAEVFIFHQGPKRKLLGILPRPDGEYFHFRNGNLLRQDRYKRDPASLAAEAEVYNAHRHPQSTGATFLYYGHDIPEERDARYHASYPQHEFGVEQFTDGLTRFGADETPFDLVVLSSCNNASPRIVSAAAPFTRFVLASPGDLHLSFIDSHPLHRAGRADVPSADLAQDLARWAFDRLSERTQTSVSLTLFDTDAIADELAAVEREYSEFVEQAPPVPVAGDFVDCRDAAMPDLEDLAGVMRWYRPPAFGRESRKTDHSGWGCPASNSALVDARKRMGAQ